MINDYSDQVSEMTLDIGGYEYADEFDESPKDDDIELGGHFITYSDDFMSFECRKCETSFEVPDIFQVSTAFNAVVYQLYALSHFRQEVCPKKDMSALGELYPQRQDDSTQDGGQVHWVKDTS